MKADASAMVIAVGVEAGKVADFLLFVVDLVLVLVMAAVWKRDLH